MTDAKAHEDRIVHILGADNLKVADESLELYRNYLQKNLVMPCELTGSEDFDWEEVYIFGSGDTKEYEKLKKTQPSYEDIFTFMSFDDQIEGKDGLMVKVKRKTDHKEFVIPLVELQATDVGSPHHQLILDYTLWFLNY